MQIVKNTRLEKVNMLECMAPDDVFVFLFLFFNVNLKIKEKTTTEARLEEEILCNTSH